MLRSERHKLLAPVVEQRIVSEEECAGFLLPQGGEGRIEFCLAANVQKNQMQSK